MSCNTCNKSFSVLRKERGCPGCGFSYCSDCLKHKIYLNKLNRESKVCTKCFIQGDQRTSREPPDSFLKRLTQGTSQYPSQNICPKLKRDVSPEDQAIEDRLQKLRENHKPASMSADEEISERLVKLRSDSVLSVTTEELKDRLSKLRGEASATTSSQLPAPDLRSDQEKANDVMFQYMEEVKIDASHKKDFDIKIEDIESRLAALTGGKGSRKHDNYKSDSESEEDSIMKIIVQAKAEAALIEPSTSSDSKHVPTSAADTSELPWCEICNEDATMRCLGCRYLFCRACFCEHKDDDFGCNRWEPYTKASKDAECMKV